ncbi:dienelactone hydrolase family protein [Ferruginibacter albus]|uniref:dienelactone hydrolase family protein n=1 Tax=Ferruginibacter albus TaxID=2875540 RepID=UPI001CC49BD9|nr:dienelactone hydrolase family protein [Ferruginibacter albus]UAY50994.1 dienelactone hydrolase family protein [Ferruginibacter albus]
MKLLSILLVGFLGVACSVDQNKSPQSMNNSIKTEAITYTDGQTSMKGYVAYDSAISGKRPVVLVVHEWWGETEYVKRRARELAALGYLAIAVDMYGDGKVAENPTDAKAMAMPFYSDPQMAKKRFDAALTAIKKYPQADNSKVAAIGYCFGGGILLNLAKLGEDLNGVVSFHGSLAGVPATKGLLKAKVLVCHGEADKFVSPEDVAAFKKQMDSINADYAFKSYANATHAFTNPDATAIGKKFSMPIEYNEAADKASWKDMQDFFAKIFK